MVNVDESFPVRGMPAGLAEALEARAIGGDDTVEFHPGLRPLKLSVRIEKFVFLRECILVPTDGLFALVLERQRKAELRTHAITVGPDVPDDAKSIAPANGVENAVYDFRITFHC
jgi:hypothetical protein